VESKLGLEKNHDSLNSNVRNTVKYGTINQHFINRKPFYPP